MELIDDPCPLVVVVMVVWPRTHCLFVLHTCFLSVCG